MNAAALNCRLFLVGDGTSTTVSFDINSVPLYGIDTNNAEAPFVVPAKLSVLSVIGTNFVSPPSSVSVTSSSLSRNTITLNLSAALLENQLYTLQLSLGLSA